MDYPPLIIDKFGDHFVIQTLALGMDIWKSAIVNSIREIFRSEKIYERNDVPVRELEGMIQQKGFLSKPFETKIIIKENGLLFEADLENGQKTGYFLDQQDNRRAIRDIVKDAEVLEHSVILAALKFMQDTMVQDQFLGWIFQKMRLHCIAQCKIE